MVLRGRTLRTCCVEDMDSSFLHFSMADWLYLAKVLNLCYKKSMDVRGSRLPVAYQLEKTMTKLMVMPAAVAAESDS